MIEVCERKALAVGAGTLGNVDRLRGLVKLVSADLGEGFFTKTLFSAD